MTGMGPLTGQSQGLGEPHEGDVIVVLAVRVVAVDNDLGNGGPLGQLVQVVGARVHLPALQDLLRVSARATESMGQLPPGRALWQHPLHTGSRSQSTTGGRRMDEMTSGGSSLS